MKFKSTYILLVVFVILLGILLVSNIRNNDNNNTGPIFPELDIEQVASVEIKRTDATYTLVKSADTWQISDSTNTYPADADAVKEMLNATVLIKKARTIGKSESLYNQYNLNEGALDVKFKDNSGDVLADFLLGSMSNDLNTYVRVPPDPNVYLATGILGILYNKTTFEWRDKTILAFDTNSINGIKIENEGSVSDMVKENGDWKVKQPEVYDADDTKMNNYLNGLNGLETVEYPEDPGDEVSGLSKPGLIITLIKEDSETITVRVAEKQPDNVYYLKVEGTPTLFVISQDIVDGLTKQASDFKVEEVQPADAEVQPQSEANPESNTDTPAN